MWILIKIPLQFVSQESNWQLVSIGSGNGLEPKLTQFIDAYMRK